MTYLGINHLSNLWHRSSPGPVGAISLSAQKAESSPIWRGQGSAALWAAPPGTYVYHVLGRRGTVRVITIGHPSSLARGLSAGMYRLVFHSCCHRCECRDPSTTNYRLQAWDLSIHAHLSAATADLVVVENHFSHRRCAVWSRIEPGSTQDPEKPFSGAAAARFQYHSSGC